MEVLFHFIFELIKISILGIVYATLTLIVFRIIGQFKPNSWFEKASKKKVRFWFLSGLFISIALFCFMFTYWGNHGLGDSARVPIGHFKVVKETNANDAYIERDKFDQIGIEKFTFDNDMLYGKIDESFDSGKGKYVVWGLRTDQWIFYQTTVDYNIAANKNNYPKPDSFEDFYTHYKRHWQGWRFWLLP